jgi:hypothetical protein
MSTKELLGSVPHTGGPLLFTLLLGREPLTTGVHRIHAFMLDYMAAYIATAIPYASKMQLMF